MKSFISLIFQSYWETCSIKVIFTSPLFAYYNWVINIYLSKIEYTVKWYFISIVVYSSDIEILNVLFFHIFDEISTRNYEMFSGQKKKKLLCRWKDTRISSYLFHTPKKPLRNYAKADVLMKCKHWTTWKANKKTPIQTVLFVYIIMQNTLYYPK